MAGRVLVLGAGGHAASSFEIGLIAGLADGGLDIRDADTFVGTSAGARVGAEVTSGASLDDIFAKQSAAPQKRMLPDIDWIRWRGDFQAARAGGGEPAEILRRIGSLTPAVAESADRRAAIAMELSNASWPEKRLLIAAIEVESGKRHVFDWMSGIELLDAVMASGTLPGVWPPIAFRGRGYIDGGFYSAENADLAAGADRVLVLALRAGVPPIQVIPLEAAIDVLLRSGAQVEVVHPDEATQAVLTTAGNLLNPNVREPATKAARDHGRTIAERIATFWQRL